VLDDVRGVRCTSRWEHSTSITGKPTMGTKVGYISVPVFALCALIAHGASAAPVEFHAIPADSVYIEQEPILVLLECRNPSKTATVECPSPDPQNGCVQLNLEALDDGSRIRRVTTWRDTFKGPRMITLAPTGTEVWVTNVLGIFGEWFTPSCPLSDAIGQACLPPGRYRLDCALTLPGTWELVQATPVVFCVAPLSAYPEEKALIEGFVSQCHPGKGREKESVSCSQEWLNRFAGRRMFSFVFYAAGFSNRQPRSEMTDFIEENEANPRRRAAFLWNLGVR
jgi:hypothetical protein